MRIMHVVLILICCTALPRGIAAPKAKLNAALVLNFLGLDKQLSLPLRASDVQQQLAAHPALQARFAAFQNGLNRLLRSQDPLLSTHLLLESVSREGDALDALRNFIATTYDYLPLTQKNAIQEELRENSDAHTLELHLYQDLHVVMARDRDFLRKSQHVPPEQVLLSPTDPQDKKVDWDGIKRTSTANAILMQKTKENYPDRASRYGFTIPDFASFIPEIALFPARNKVLYELFKHLRTEIAELSSERERLVNKEMQLVFKNDNFRLFYPGTKVTVMAWKYSLAKAYRAMLRKEELRLHARYYAEQVLPTGDFEKESKLYQLEYDLWMTAVVLLDYAPMVADFEQRIKD